MLHLLPTIGCFESCLNKAALSFYPSILSSGARLIIHLQFLQCQQVKPGSNVWTGLVWHLCFCVRVRSLRGAHLLSSESTGRQRRGANVCISRAYSLYFFGWLGFHLTSAWISIICVRATRTPRCDFWQMPHECRPTPGVNPAEAPGACVDAASPVLTFRRTFTAN